MPAVAGTMWQWRRASEKARQLRSQVANMAFVRGCELIADNKVWEGMLHLANALRNAPTSVEYSSAITTAFEERNIPFDVQLPLEMPGGMTSLEVAGTLAVTRDAAGQAFVWDLVTWEKLHDYPVLDVCTVLSGGDDDVLLVLRESNSPLLECRDLRSGEMLWKQQRKSQAALLSRVPERWGRHPFICQDETGIHVIDLVSQESILAFDQPATLTRMSPDQRLMAMALGDHLRIINVYSSRVLWAGESVVLS